MHFYHLTLTLLAQHRDNVPSDLFDTLPSILSCADRDAKSPVPQPPQPPRRRSSRTVSHSHSATAITAKHNNVPPTPLRSPKHSERKSQTSQPDARFGPVTIEDPHDEKVTQCGQGILHFFRDTDGDEWTPDSLSLLQDSQSKKDLGKLLCILAVPSYLSTKDLVSFIRFDPAKAQARILRDNALNKYTVVLKFRHRKDAHDFYQHYNGRQFNALEPEICHVVYLQPSGMLDALVTTTSQPSLDETMSIMRPPGTHEMPTCPVCLERMDEGNTGLRTMLCEHTSQCYCLSKWGDTNCPTCLYSQKPVHEGPSTSGTSRSVPKADQACFACGSKESLWICMICGHIGCGRYQDAHAYDHYMETGHMYALEIESQNVWDYGGDGYVHRLIQNQVDGRVVEFPSSTSTVDNRTVSKQKMEAMANEYTYLLTSQLDTQRTFYEDQVEAAQIQLSTLTAQVNELSGDVDSLRVTQKGLDEEKQDVEKQLGQARRDHGRVKRRLETVNRKREEMERDWREEKELTESLAKNCEAAKKQAALKQLAVDKIMERVSELMTQLESQSEEAS
ncbi:hypothetical protein BCR43DRAFT_464733 [Syncephalastrum racemosum]|uniref:BRCA1-associated protein 2-domain-containing protein n=1 Tax=Syncephalastrum racemosum TaxID=13706 RepID=A0A1X2GZJ8_SYNRA|nr:hypothetical protein BCR43DRAFT_464733 [Syncephalastrum racemosum]